MGNCDNLDAAISYYLDMEDPEDYDENDPENWDD
jgi:hypothetical protein